MPDKDMQANVLTNADTGDRYRAGTLWCYDDNMLIGALEAGGYVVPEGEMWDGLRDSVADALDDNSQALFDAVTSHLWELEERGLIQKS